MLLLKCQSLRKFYKMLSSLSSVSKAITRVGAETIWTPAIFRQIPSSSYLLEAAVLAFGFDI